MLEKNETFDSARSRVLGQIWVAQSLFHVFPSEERLLEFVLQTLRSFSDIKDCGMCVQGVIAPIHAGTSDECAACVERDSFSGEDFQPICHLSRSNGVWVVPLDTADQRYGYIQIVPQQPEVFESFKALFLNFFNSIAITLENRSQKRKLEASNEELRKHTAYLDHLVNERTAELRVKNERLGEELAQRRLVEEELKIHRNNLEELIKERTSQLKIYHERMIHTEKLSALGKMAGSIAHEFNNPIYGLRNVVLAAMEEGQFSQEIKDLLALGIKECDRMADLIRRLQDFYKPTAELAKTSLNINRIVDEMAALTSREFKSHKITVEKNYAPEMPNIHAVEGQMKQLVLNLLQNAAEAMEPAGGTITITTEVCGANIRVAIKDTGEGIPEKNIKSIFEPFFSTRDIKGTGLGLFVCHGIVNAHGGEILVESRVGEGSTFTIVLPIIKKN